MTADRLLIGRDRELGTVDPLLDSDAASLLIVEGAPGIGKTAFLEAVSELITGQGRRRLIARPARAEADLSFAGLGDLLDGHDIELDTLAEPQRAALEVALLLRSPGKTLPSARTVGTALLGLLRNMAAVSPLLLIIDDVQWLDQPSASTIRFALRRLRGEPVTTILARRSGTAPDLGEWAPDGIGMTIVLEPLTLGATHALLSQRLQIELKRPTLRLIHEWSRGNPLHALELARAYQSGSVRFDPSSSVPVGLELLMTTRVESLPAVTRLGLATIAASRLTTESQLEHVLGEDVFESSLRPAFDDGVIEATGGRIRFTHPLLASAAYSSVDPMSLRSVHARLVEVTDDPDERARHLAHAIDGPDANVAAALELAADNVFRRGAPLHAAGLAELARERTPPDDVAGARRRARAEAGYRFEAGDTLAAAALVSDLASTVETGSERAGLLSLLARYQHFADGLAASAAYLVEARQEAGEDADIRFGIEEGLAWNRLLMRADLTEANEAASNAVRFARELGQPSSVAEALAVAALTQSAMGGDGSGLIDDALELEEETLSLRVLRHPSFAQASLLTSLDRFDEALEVFGELVERAEASGDESAMPTLYHHLGLVHCLRGDYPMALEYAETAVAIAAGDDQIPAQTSAWGRVALTHARRGDPEASLLAADRALQLASPEGHDPDDPGPAMTRGGEVAIWASGLSAFQRGDVDGAVRHLVPMAEVFLRSGYRRVGDTRFVIDTIEALAIAGDLEQARTLVTWMETMPEEPAGAAGCIEMGRGLVAAGEGTLSLAELRLEAATEALRLAPLPHELGRALLALGKVRRRARSKTRAFDTLEESARVFEDIGAGGWAAQAREEASRVGGRGHSPEGLTETELRVTELVVAGHSNREIAERIYVSTKTVEATLTRLYARVGVRSRTELVRWAMERQATTTE